MEVVHGGADHGDHQRERSRSVLAIPVSWYSIENGIRRIERYRFTFSIPRTTSIPAPSSPSAPANMPITFSFVREAVGVELLGDGGSLGSMHQDRCTLVQVQGPEDGDPA